MKIREFQGLRPSEDKVEKVASLPYDVVSTEEARALAHDNPFSFLHVVRAEIDLAPGADQYAQDCYDKALENLEKLKDKKALVRESEPCMYAYRQEMNGHAQIGITAVCHVDDYENDIIKKHEKTRPQKENDRLKLNTTLNAHPGPVFLTYRDNATIDSIINDVQSTDPLFDFTADDGVKHTVWKITEYGSIIDTFGAIPESYVADGHHRSASAARLAKAKREKNPGHDGTENYNWFLAVLFPESQLNVLPYNRIVKDLNGLSIEEFIEKVKAVGTLTETENKSPTKAGSVSIYLDKRWFNLEMPVASETDPTLKLDVSYLQNNILSPLLGIEDPRTSDKIDFIGGIRGTKELEKRVDQDGFAVAFSMFPVTTKQLMDIADAGQIMPPKSTWFEPKLRSGLFIHTV